MELRRTGRDEHETVEIPPTVLDCGHPTEGNVESVSFAAASPVGERVRTYRCRECGATTWDD